jgi:hypothetical protein
VDRVLRTLVSRAVQRGRTGDPIWLAVAAVAWLLQRSIRKSYRPAWVGRLEPGEGLVIAVGDRSTMAPSTGGE